MPNLPGPAPEVPNTGRRWWPWASGAVLAAGFGGLLWLQPWATAVKEVGVESVALSSVSRILAVNGRVASKVSVQVRPLVSGTLLEVRVSKGDVAEVGDVLALIDPATQVAIVRQAVAGLDAALVAQAEAQSTYSRTEALGANATKVVMESAARAVQLAKQEVERMTALLDQAQIALGRYTIRAPVAGSVLGLAAEPGQTTEPSTVMMTIADLGQLVIEADVDETYATQIHIGQPSALQLTGETGVRPGHVGFVSQQVDEATGSLGIELTPDTPLVAPLGLTVTANITVDDRSAAITVPRTAIVKNDNGSGVFVVKSGLVRLQPVTVIAWPAARLIATDGLLVGDRIIRDASGIADGQQVKVAP